MKKREGRTVLRQFTEAYVQYGTVLRQFTVSELYTTLFIIAMAVRKSYHAFEVIRYVNFPEFLGPLL
jgi:hypothetical protein